MFLLWEEIRLEFVEEVTQEQLDRAVVEFFNRDEIIVYRFKKNSPDKKPVNIRPAAWYPVLFAEY